MIYRCAGSTFKAAVCWAILMAFGPVIGWSESQAQGLASCGPSPIGATCGGAGPASLGNTGGTNQGAGNPINILTGNKYQREVDMVALPGELGVEIVRHYNSLDRAPGSFGVGWRLSYDTELVVVGNSIQISQADGHRITFNRNPLRPADCIALDPANGVLKLQKTRTGATRYLWIWPNGRSLSFSATGRLDEISDGHGGLTTLTRGLRGELLAVTDPLGRQLLIRYGSDMQGGITAIESPIGTFSYTYAASIVHPSVVNLTSVTLSDRRTIRRYHYEEKWQAGNPHALTGISVQTVLAKWSLGPLQRLSTYAYESSGRAIWSMRGDGIEKVMLRKTTQVAAGAKSAIASLINARGEETRYAFAIIGGGYRLLSADGPGCAHCGVGGSRYQYDSRGRLLVSEEPEVDGGGRRRVEYTYDAPGRIVKIRAPSVISGKFRELEYLYSDRGVAAGTPVAKIERGFSASGPIERRIDYTFDSAGRLQSQGSTRFNYDKSGRVVTRHEADGATTRYEYDRLSRASRIALPDGRIVRYAYDARGRTSTISIDGRAERYEYDAAERLSRVVRPNGERLDYQYDAADRVARITDANGNRIAFGRDPEGQLLHREFYDSNGALLQRRSDASEISPGPALAVGLDGGGRPSTLFGANSTLGGYEYDDFGRLTRAYTQDGGVTRFEYDLADRLVGKVMPSGARIVYQYRADGRRIEKLTPEGKTTLQLGVNRRPQSVEFPGGAESFSYDSSARLVQHTYHLNGVVYRAVHRYGSAGELLEKTLPGGQKLLFTYRQSPARNAGLLQSIHLVQDTGKTALIENLNGERDTLNRRGFLLLSRAAFQRELDIDGNLLKIGADGLWQQSFEKAGDLSKPHLERRAADQQLAGMARHKGGPTLRDEERQLQWDSESRLIAVSRSGRRVADYSYDAAGQRISKTVYSQHGATTTRFIYEQDRLIAEIDASGKVRKQYVWLDDQPIAIIEADRVLGIVADQTFAPRVVFDQKQSFDVERITNLRGSHQYFDPESGLLYNGRRYLDPKTQSYLSADPLGVAGGPDSFAFAARNPAQYVDLTGLQVQPVTAVDASVANWSLEEKLGFIFKDAASQIQDRELAAALRELISPQAIATTAIIFSTWAASQFTPYGWAADLALTGVGALFLGKSIWDVIEATYQVATGLSTARCESDLHQVSGILARGLSQAAASLTAATAAGAAVGGARIARLLRSVFRRDVSTLRRSRSLAAINQQRFGVFNPTRGSYSGRIANQEWILRQRANGRSDAHPPWDPGKSVVDTWLNPGQKVYIIQDRGAGPGGWATPKQYRSLEEARNELSVLEEFKRSDSDLVLQEYTVTAAMPVRSGFSGPQISGWPASETYVGGGQQIQLLVDTRGANWESYMTPTQTLELGK